MASNRRADRQRSSTAATQIAPELKSIKGTAQSLSVKAESAARAAVLAHNCLTQQGLRRNSKGQPSATATYTALRKAAAGGSLIPEACQPDKSGAQDQRTCKQFGAQTPSLHEPCQGDNVLPVNSAAVASQKLDHETNVLANWMSSDSQHHSELQLLWEEAQAAMQELAVPESSQVQPDTADQPLHQGLHAEASCSSSKSRVAGSAAASTSAADDADEQEAGQNQQQNQQQQQKQQQQKQQQQQQAKVDQHQRVRKADKQVQAGNNTDRVSVRRHNSQNSGLQTSPSMHSMTMRSMNMRNTTMRSMRPILGETTLNMLELSKIIKHLQAQLDQQEAIGETLQAQLTKSHADVEHLYALEAAQEDIIQQAQMEGIEIGRHEVAQERFLKQKLEQTLDRKLLEQQAAADKEVAAAVQAAAHVASLQQHIQHLKIQNETTLKSKLKADRRNMDLQRRHDALKEDQQHTQRALTASQEQVAALEDRLYVLRRVNSQLERSESHAQRCTSNAHDQVKVIQQERNLLMAMLRDQADLAMQDSYTQAESPRKDVFSLQRGMSDSSVLAGSLRERFTGSLPRPDTQHAQQAQLSQSMALSTDAVSGAKTMADHAATRLSADVAHAAQPRAAAEEQSVDGLQFKHGPVLSGHAMSLPAQMQQSQSQPISRASSGMPFSSSKLKALGLGRIAENQVDLFGAHQAFWQKKAALCPDIKNCIQEVQQLRAQLSLESENLFSDSKN